MVAGKLDLQKRQHRERSQPLHRQKLGLLEKHADYVKRARDFHSKEDRIQKLREKASMRNKDEFYFGMIRSKTKNGVHIQSRGNEPLPTDLVKVLKTQDSTYIRMHAKMEQGRVDRLEEQLASLVDLALPAAAKGKKAAAVGDGDEDYDDWDMYSDDETEASTSSKRNHIVFTDNIDAVRSGSTSSLLRKRSTPTALPSDAPVASTSSASSGSTTSAAAAHVPRTRKGKSRAAQQDALSSAAELSSVSADVASSAAAHRASLERELAARRERLVQLRRAARELELQRALMGRGAKSQVVRHEGDRKAGENEWWAAGEKGAGKGKARREAEEREGALPMADEGVTTGARVWKWKAQRKR
ncbi:rRNA-processing protein UTP11 [Rhodotorula paludigena]|uniref:rRNA-processing protein UTP11 n=1 Tax=Rhodotorula paludigena TaxID=86838 RepID=UPI0031808577